METRTYSESDGYKVVCSFDAENGSVEIHMGGKVQHAGLYQPQPCVKPHVEALKKMGKNPSQYRSLGTVVLRIGAAEFVQGCHGEQQQMVAQADVGEEAAIPGLEELREAEESWEIYHERFGRMMEDESNDGARPPQMPSVKLEEIQAKYPRATLYLKAEAYSQAANSDKASAGHRAMELLVAGGSEEEAANILNNWLPENAFWN